MLSLLQTEFIKIGIIVIFAIILCSIIILMSNLFNPTEPDVEKLSIYECGFDPYEDARNTYDVKFYIIAILFIIFDLETVFFFPWCVSISLLHTNGIFFMIDFVLELLIGYYYAWEIGALDWAHLE